MRILLDQAVHDHRNTGNNALLEISLRRLRRLWPNASFDVLSIAPHLCHARFPGTNPVRPDDLGSTPNDRHTSTRLLPHRLWDCLFELRDSINERTGLALSLERPRRPMIRLNRYATGPLHQIAPGLGSGTGAPAIRRAADQPIQLNRADIAEYDLVVATGGGYLCDGDKRFVLPLLDRLELAVTCGIPAVMVGQGVGPISDPELLTRLRQVLPSVDLVLIREERQARPLLEGLDVPPSRVLMTGDDAIELAYSARRAELGSGIGVSVRVASHTEVTRQHLPTIRAGVQAPASTYGADLVSAPIDVNDGDKRYIDEVTRGCGKVSGSWLRYESTDDLLRRIGRSRVMVSGTFHGAVFALGQGIPVVALAKSQYHTGKVNGLVSEFGNQGCQVVHLDAGCVASELAAAISLAWSDADQLRPALLEAAERQIGWAWRAYERIGELVESRRGQHV